MSSSKILALILTLVFFAQVANACDELQWEVNGKKEAVCYDPKLNAMLSAKCLTSSRLAPIGARSAT